MGLKVATTSKRDKMSYLSDESFSSVKDASLHCALMANERLKREKANGLIYLFSLILLYALLSPGLSLHTLVFLWCLYLPVRDIYRASKEKEIRYNQYIETLETKYDD